jgi:hypothetical protein
LNNNSVYYPIIQLINKNGRPGAEMMAQNIREPNKNSHEEYSTQKSKSVGAKHTETFKEMRRPHKC